MVDEGLIRDIVMRVLSAAPENVPQVIPLEISARHVHLSQEHVDQLFGQGWQLTPLRDISQPGQFLCEERVRLIGEKGVLENVAVLGPIRPKTQVEISASDARAIGAIAPLRMSGDLRDAGGIIIAARDKVVRAGNCVIIAKNHIHMTPEDAASRGLGDGVRVNVQVAGGRPMTFDNVVVRVTSASRLAMHIDVDEANACLCRPDSVGTIASINRSPSPPVSHVLENDGGDALGKRDAASAAASRTMPPSGRKRIVVDAESALALCRGGGDVCIPVNAIITPLARDIFSAEKVVPRRECL